MTALPTPLQIRLDDLSDPRIEAFMQEHLQDMYAVSPPECVHALDMDQLRQPDIALWSAWLPGADGGMLVGTGALKRLDADHAELKSMRSAESLRGLGVGRAILEHILGQAVDLGYQRISLETGSQPFFEPAWQLYLRYGFADCAPFGSYRPDPHSRFMTRAL